MLVVLAVIGVVAALFILLVIIGAKSLEAELGVNELSEEEKTYLKKLKEEEGDYRAKIWAYLQAKREKREQELEQQREQELEPIREVARQNAIKEFRQEQAVREIARQKAIKEFRQEQAKKVPPPLPIPSKAKKVPPPLPIPSKEKEDKWYKEGTRWADSYSIK